jgi:hypothetical protein
MPSRELQFSMSFTTAQAGSAECTNFLGQAIGTVNTILWNALGAVVANILATQTVVDFIFPREIEIRKMTITIEPGKTGTGKLFILSAPASPQPNELVSNYSLSFMTNNKEISVEPTVPPAMKAISNDFKTIRFMIKGHTVGQQISYQVSFEAEEFT